MLSRGAGLALLTALLLLLPARLFLSSEPYHAHLPSLPHFLKSSIKAPLILSHPNGLAASTYQAAHIGGKNPLDPTTALQIDGHFRAEYNAHVSVGQDASLLIKCSHPNVETHCPRAYRVLFDGPTLVSPVWSSSSSVEADGKAVRVSYRLEDPGEYKIYAWPEYIHCDAFQTQDIVWNKVAIAGSPLPLTVTGQAHMPEYQECSVGTAGQQLGRWVSKAHLNPEHLAPTSAYQPWMVSHLTYNHSEPFRTVYDYLWLPYNCALPHRSWSDYFDLVKPSSLVVFGDSLIRDFFCLNMWKNVFGIPEPGTTCAWNHDTGPTAFPTTPKHGRYLRKDGGVTNLHFFWAPKGEASVIEESLNTLQETPSHIIYSAGLWLAGKSPEQYVEAMAPTLALFKNRLPNAQVAVRGGSSTVQATQCYDLIGGQRWQLEANNAALKAYVDEAYPEYTYVDAYSITNSIPQSSSDGRHWAGIGDIRHHRTQCGVAEDAVFERVFYDWL